MSKNLSIIMILTIAVYGATMLTVMANNNETSENGIETASVHYQNSNETTVVGDNNEENEISEEVEITVVAQETVANQTPDIANNEPGQVENTDIIDNSENTEPVQVPETIIETEPEAPVAPETETVRKKKKKRKKKDKTVITTNAAITTTTAQITSKKEETTKKQVKSVGSHSESNKISSSKISVIRNSVSSNFSGSSDSEKTNLARYMSASGKSNAKDAYKELTNSDKNLSSKTCSISIASDSQEDILNAAQKAANSIGRVSGSYGIGISSVEKTVGYKIYIVVVY